MNDGYFKFDVCSISATPITIVYNNDCYTLHRVQSVCGSLPLLLTAVSYVARLLKHHHSHHHHHAIRYLLCVYHRLVIRTKIQHNNITSKREVNKSNHVMWKLVYNVWVFIFVKNQCSQQEESSIENARSKLGTQARCYVVDSLRDRTCHSGCTISDRQRGDFVARMWV